MEKPIKKYVMLLAALALSANAVVGSVLVQAEEPPSGVDKLVPPSSPEDGRSETGVEPEKGEENMTQPTHDPVVIAAFVEDLRDLRQQLVEKQTAGWRSTTEGTIEGAIEYLDDTIYEYLHITDNTLDSVEHRAEIKESIITFINLLTPPVGEQPQPEQPETPAPENPGQGEQPKPETPKPEDPKPGETPESEAPKPENPKPGETPTPENPKPEAPKPGETPTPEQPKPGETPTPEQPKPEAQGEVKATLPATGEADSFAIFSAAALTILASVGMLAYGKREE